MRKNWLLKPPWAEMAQFSTSSDFPSSLSPFVLPSPLSMNCPFENHFDFGRAQCKELWRNNFISLSDRELVTLSGLPIPGEIWVCWRNFISGNPANQAQHYSTPFTWFSMLHRPLFFLALEKFGLFCYRGTRGGCSSNVLTQKVQNASDRNDPSFLPVPRADCFVAQPRLRQRFIIEVSIFWMVANTIGDPNREFEVLVFYIALRGS